MATGRGDLFYAKEKISGAVDILAKSHGRLQKRLLDGWMSQGCHALPMGSGQAGEPMSEELIERLEAFDEQMSRRPATGDEGAFAATILSMTDEEASDAARELIDIKYQVEAELRDR